MNERMNEWMHEWMNVMNEAMDERIETTWNPRKLKARKWNEWMNEMQWNDTSWHERNEWMYECMNEAKWNQMLGNYMNEWISEWMNESMYDWMNERNEMKCTYMINTKMQLNEWLKRSEAKWNDMHGN